VDVEAWSLNVQDSATLGGDLDAGGNNLTNVGTVKADKVNRDGSWREGTVVRYDPRDSGPYVDGQDALADVPDGGEFRLAATVYKPAEEGRLFLTNKVVDIIGEGWSRDDSFNISGTHIKNTGFASVSDAPIEFAPSTRKYFGRVANLAIKHEVSGTPAVKSTDVVKMTLNNLHLNGITSSNTTMTEFLGDSYFSSVMNSEIIRWTSQGIKVSGGGGSYLFYNNSCGSSSGVGLEIDAGEAFVYGGQYGGGEAGIKLVNNSGSNRTNGSVINSVRFENPDYGVDINTGGSDQHNNNKIVNCSSVQTVNNGLVRFGNGSKNVLRSPKGSTGAADLAVWESESLDSGIVATAAELQGHTWTDNNSFRPYVCLQGPANANQFSSLPTDGVPIGPFYDTSNNLLAWHNGTDWYSVSGSTYNP